VPAPMIRLMPSMGYCWNDNCDGKQKRSAVDTCRNEYFREQEPDRTLLCFITLAECQHGYDWIKSNIKPKLC
jgi:hypothetical protein